jgi:Tol biopolymer transport system component
MICVAGNEIYTWNPLLDIRAAVHVFAEYKNLQFGPYKGNPSKDGTRLVVRATNSQGELVAFAYDISAQRKYPDIKLANLSGRNGYCTISPSGRYVFCANATFDGTDIAYVFTTDGVQLQHWTEHHRPGHGDITTDTDGSEVYVGISKASPDKFHIIKRRLDDGAVTDLAPYGDGQHASIRNINRPGWVFVTYSGTYSEVTGHLGGAPFYQEVIALRIDGSGELRRVIQTRDVKYDYWSESHASPSPDGSQIIWSSNWGNPGGPVADFVARLPWPEPTTVGSTRQ